MPTADRKAKVLFLCTGNSCRSQMAEGWTNRLKSGQIEAYSAGTEPHGLNPLAVRAMAEVGVDISGHTSKRPEQIGVEFDYVVTVCDSAHETCPIFPARTRVIHVGFDDPPRLAKSAASDEEALSHYRRVRDEIKAFVLTLPESLSTPSTGLRKENSMPTVKVFDPPMCCSTGSCGPDPDIALTRFAADLQWLQSQGVVVERFSLSQQPDKFTQNVTVMQAMKSRSADVLPIVMVNDQVVAERRYPAREQLAARLGLTPPAQSTLPVSSSCGCGPSGCC